MSRWLSMVTLLTAVATSACRTGRGSQEASGQRCASGGVLRVGNHSGAPVDIYAMRASAAPEFLTQLSMGQSQLEVSGPEDVGVRYDVVDSRTGRRLQTVSWIRSRSTGGSVIVELACAAPPTSSDRSP
jgi:hypothetical protein